MDQTTLILAAFTFTLGGLCCYFYTRLKVGSYQDLGKKILEQADKDSLEKCNALIKETKARLESEETEWRRELQKRELNLERQKARLEEQEAEVSFQKEALKKRVSLVEEKERALAEVGLKLEKEKNALFLELEKTAVLSQSEARLQLFETLERELKKESAAFIKKSLDERHEKVEEEAAKLIASALMRVAASTVSEVTTTTVPIASDEMKGRIIGREGRNIRALEKATGVSFVMDDTPQAIVISSFDPVRRHIAKLTLQELVLDGRIHPTRIEEAREKAEALSKKQIQEWGESAAHAIGVYNFQKEIITLLGKLKLRYSLGQNVLDHSLEVAHIMGLVAEELSLDAPLARRIGLLHDIGKAVSDQMEGTHALIGRDLALKNGESELVANGIGCHHYEIDPISLEASLTAAADAISASRPGARSQQIDAYFRRLKKLEEISLQFPAVEQAFILQGGKEIRALVLPESIAEEEMTHLARDLARRIEKEVDFPGKIRVTVLREKRVVDYAM